VWKLLFKFVGMDNFLFFKIGCFIFLRWYFLFHEKWKCNKQGDFSKSGDISGSYFFQEIHKLTTKFVSVIIFLDMCKTLAQFLQFFVDKNNISSFPIYLL